MEVISSKGHTSPLMKLGMLLFLVYFLYKPLFLSAQQKQFRNLALSIVNIPCKANST